MKQMRCWNCCSFWKFIFLTEPGTVVRAHACVCVCVCVCMCVCVCVSEWMFLCDCSYSPYLHCCDKIEWMSKSFCILLIYLIWIRGFLIEKIVISNCSIPGWNLNTNFKRKCQNVWFIVCSEEEKHAACLTWDVTFWNDFLTANGANHLLTNVITGIMLILV